MTSMDWEGLIGELDGMSIETDRALVRQKSRDFFWYSPILKERLNRKSADLVVAPRSEAEVVRVLKACARRHVPVTPRGAGTGNYGQAVPLEGGVLLDLSLMDAIVGERDGMLTVSPGAKLIDIERAMRPRGWELRMYPSTKRTATIGGFIAGGSGGVGSIAWGGLRDRGNLLGLRLVTAEPEPRVLTLAGDATSVANHAYGTTGVITELTIPLAPLTAWRDVVAIFPDHATACAAAWALGTSDGIAKKLATVMAPGIAGYFKPLAGVVAPDSPLLIAMIGETSMIPFRELIAERGGRIVHEVPMVEAEADPAQTPVYEYTWNHTTLHALKVDKGVTYLQSLFPADRALELVALTRDMFGDELLQHLEFIRAGGAFTCAGLQLLRYSTPERLNEIIATLEGLGISIANPHVHTLEDGAGHKRVGDDQLRFKGEVDPLNLLNPGKMRSYRAGIRASAE